MFIFWKWGFNPTMTTTIALENHFGTAKAMHQVLLKTFKYYSNKYNLVLIGNTELYKKENGD